MNLSMMLYVAGVADTVREFFFFWGIIFLVVWVIGFVVYYFLGFFPEDSEALAFRTQTKPILRNFVSAGFALYILAAIVPESRSIYLIAGVQAAETVVASTDAQEILGMVKAKIKSMLAVPDTTSKK